MVYMYPTLHIDSGHICLLKKEKKKAIFEANFKF